MKRFFTFLLVFAFAIGIIDRSLHKANASFSLKKITPNWESIHLTFDPQGTWQQDLSSLSWTYLDKGLESFVFLSSDEKWVIKFLQLPKAFRKGAFGSKQKKGRLLETIQSCQLAGGVLSEETAVFYTHLGPTSHLPASQIIDRSSNHLTIDLNQTLFVIQKAGVPFFKKFENHPHPQDLIAQTVQLYKELYEKGYIDNEPIFEKNLGVLGTKPFIMDIGMLKKREDSWARADYLKSMTNSLFWELKNTASPLFPYYQNLLQ